MKIIKEAIYNKSQIGMRVNSINPFSNRRESTELCKKRMSLGLSIGQAAEAAGVSISTIMELESEKFKRAK